MYELLILGQEKIFERSNAMVDLAAAYGFIREKEGCAVIHNRISEPEQQKQTVSSSCVWTGCEQ